MLTHLLNRVFVPLNRRFADIEAANHRLASALYLKEEEKDASSLSAEERDTADRSGGSAPDLSRPAEAAASARSDALFNPRDPDGSGEKQSGLEQPEPETAACRGQSKALQQQENNTHQPAGIPSTSSRTACQPSAQGRPPSSPPETASNASASQIAQPDPAYMEFTPNVDACPAASPGLGPLSPQSCDLSVWMFSDSSTCTHAQKSTTDISESQWSDIVDLLSVGSPDGAYAELEACFESICACRGDAGQGVEPAEFGFVDFFDSFTENPGATVFEGGRLHGDTCEYMREDGHGREQATQRQNEGSLSTAHAVAGQQLPASLSYRSDGSELQACQHPQGEGPCTLGSKPHFTPFEGVAQSFTVPHHCSRPRAFPTLPREEDWPFTDILEDRASMYG